MKCLFCNKNVNRFKPKSTTIKAKYCSARCTKKAWYLRRNPNTKIFLKNKKEFLLTETGKGFRWEKYIAKMIGAKHLEFNGSDADLQLGKLKIDVKSCELYKRKTKRGKPVKYSQGWWTFNRNKEKPIDYFICVCLLKDKPVKILKIPSNQFPIKGTTVGFKSKFDKYDILKKERLV